MYNHSVQDNMSEDCLRRTVGEMGFSNPKIVIVVTSKSRVHDKQCPLVAKVETLILQECEKIGKWIEIMNYSKGSILDEKSNSDVSFGPSFIQYMRRFPKRESNFTGNDALIVIILGIGADHEMMCMEDQTVIMDSFTEPFTRERCSYFRDKPKIFIAQTYSGIPEFLRPLSPTSVSNLNYETQEEMMYVNHVSIPVTYTGYTTMDCMLDSARCYMSLSIKDLFDSINDAVVQCAGHVKYTFCNKNDDVMLQRVKE